jgi:hypothetical protein
MEHGFRKHRESQEQNKFKADDKQLDNEIDAAEALVSQLQTKLEYIRSHVSELDSGNARLTKVYGIMVTLDQLMSSIVQLRNMKANLNWKTCITQEQNNQYQEQRGRNVV